MRDRLLVAALGAVLFLPGLGWRDVWNPDEARYAEVAREMLASGDLLIPHLNGEVYAEKPPLFFWAIVAGSLATGGEVTAAAARLPCALGAIGSLLLVFAMGDRLFGRRVAWLAATVFATSTTVIWQARFGQIDMFLAFWVTLGVYFWVRGWTEGRPGFYWLFFAATGIATVAKGPAGMLPPLLAIVAFLAWSRDWQELRRLRIGWGLLLWAAVVLAWLVPAGLAGGDDYWRGLVFKQNLTRYANPWHHQQPWWYFLGVVPGDFFPWSFLLPTALIAGWRRFLRPRPAAAGAGADEAGLAGSWAAPGFRFALSWVAVTLLFFSLSPAKRSVYVLSMYPGLALAVGAGLAAAAEAGRRRWLAVPCGLVAALAAAAAVALPVLGLGRPELADLGPAFLWVLDGVAAALALAAAYAAWAALRGRVERVSPRIGAGLAAGMAVLALAAGLYLLPTFDVFKSARPLAAEYLARSAPGEPYGTFPKVDPPFLFYTRRCTEPLASGEELAAFLARPGRVWVFAQRSALEKLPAPPPGVEVARDRRPTDDGYVLLTNSPEGAR